MVKIKAVFNYYDKQREEQIPAGTEYEVSPERAKQIIKKGYALEVKEEKAKEEKSKKHDEAMDDNE